MDMNLVHELVEIVFVTGAEVDESLDSLVRICGDLLTLAGFDSLDRVVNEYGEVCDAVVDICRLVHAHKRFVEDGEEVTEELEGCGLISLVDVPLLAGIAALPPR